ncbi:hypothetical protein AM274_16635 [Pseudomonas nunensis]|nr:hypothetical protein AM274_16635 [Pseudomonas nunensis]
MGELQQAKRTMTSSVRHGAAGHNQDEEAEWCAIRLGDDDRNAAVYGPGTKPVGASLLAIADWQTTQV